jgi:isoleucyl-tRNA synthetase
MTAPDFALADTENPNIAQSKYDFVKEEEKVLQFWKEIDAFKTSLKMSEGKPEYSFYDGTLFLVYRILF